MQRLKDGGYAINDRFEIGGEGSSFFVFAQGWLLEIVDVEKGDYYFFSNARPVLPKRPHFGVYYPPFTITKTYVKAVRATVTGVGAVDRFPQLPSTPVIFETDFTGEFTSSSQALEVLSRGKDRQSIEVSTDPSLISIRAKRLIDENYRVYPAIARIAARLNITHEHLTRQFKRDFGLTPSGYLHQLRVADATFRLSLGEEIIDISHEVGYNDLSRFYKQFRKSTRTSPAACRETMEK